MSEFGTFIVDRGVFSHPFFTPQPFTEVQAWLWLCASAAKSPRDLRKNHTVVHIDRGQLCYSRRFMAKRWDWPLATVHRFISRLVTELMVTETHPSQQTVVITICNYDKYQSDQPPRIHEIGTGVKQIRETLSLDSRDSVVDDGVARARESFKITQQAYQLADEVMQTLGIDLNFIPPAWMGCAMWMQTGLNGGWRPDLVRIAAARIRARKRHELPYNFRYLEKPIQREHQLAAEPHLPIPPVVVSQNQDVTNAQKTVHAHDWKGRRDDRSGLAAIDRVFDRLSAVRSGSDQGPDENPVRSLPSRSVSGS